MLDILTLLDPRHCSSFSAEREWGFEQTPNASDLSWEVDTFGEIIRNQKGLANGMVSVHKKREPSPFSLLSFAPRFSGNPCENR